jgi:hypothetical protein
MQRAIILSIASGIEGSIARGAGGGCTIRVFNSSKALSALLARATQTEI